MSQIKTWMVGLGVTFSLAVAPEMAWSKSLKVSKLRKKILVGQINRSSAKRAPSSINFNGLIANSDSHRNKLARRVQVKTATRAEKAGDPARQTNFKFDDMNIKWNQKGSKPAFSSAALGNKDLKTVLGEATLRLMPRSH